METGHLLNLKRFIQSNVQAPTGMYSALDTEHRHFSRKGLFDRHKTEQACQPLI